MPKAIYLIPDVRESMLRPTVVDIARQVLEWTGLPRTTQLMYAGENTEVFQPGSTISTEPKFNQLDSDPRWTINVDERTHQEQELTASVDYMDHPPIFNDTETKVLIRPSYVEVDLVFNFTSKFTDRNHARMWRNDLRARAAANREARYHKVSYSYLIPEECIDIAAEINRMREKVAPYGETFTAYWNRFITPKATVLSDNAGKNTRWAVAETQAEIIGFFDFPAESEEGQKHSENSSWDIDFTYTAKIHIPTVVWMSYPLMIHNQFIAKAFRQTSLPPRPEDTKLEYSMIAGAMSQFLAQNQALRVQQRMPGMSMPAFDEFIPDSGTIPLDTLRVVTALTNIDESNPLELMSFDPLGSKHHIDPDVLNFMKIESPWMTRYRYSIFNVVVFKNDKTIPLDEYYVTPDLKVMLRKPPDLRSQYHVRLSLYQRPRLLPPEAKLRLRNNCKAAIILMMTLDPEIEKLNPTCMTQNFMSDQLFNKVVEKIDTAFDSRWNKQHIQFNTVMTFVINAH